MVMVSGGQSQSYEAEGKGQSQYRLKVTYHPVGDDGPRGNRQAGEQTHRVTTVQDQGLVLSHLTQVVQDQTELRTHTNWRVRLDS